MTTSPSLGLSFAFAASLWAFIESSTTSLGKDTSILHLAVEAFKRKFEGLTRVNLDFTHSDYQRDRRSLRRPVLCSWKQSLQYTGRSSLGLKGT
jgi:hypothetical protein